MEVAALREQTRAQLSAYKVPTRWVLADAADIPTLPSGKFDRKGLLARVVDGSLATL